MPLRHKIRGIKSTVMYLILNFYPMKINPIPNYALSNDKNKTLDRKAKNSRTCTGPSKRLLAKD